jgi:hypothetical protein
MNAGGGAITIASTLVAETLSEIKQILRTVSRSGARLFQELHISEAFRVGT